MDHSFAKLENILSVLSGKPLSPSGFAVVLSPSITVVYPSLWMNLVGFLKSGGARRVLPVASGIPDFAFACAEAIKIRGPGIQVLSACPAAIDFLAAEFPGLADRVLDVPSPMALSAQASLRLGGIPHGSAVAVSSCSLKKREEGRVPFDMRVIAVARLLDALSEAGIALEDWTGIDFDEGSRSVPPKTCTVPDMVGEALEALGLGPVSVMKLEGAEKAHSALSKLSARGDDLPAYQIIELTFCENGCIREPGL